jgi:predicted alpha/beta superfamily hydrolase
MAPSTQQLFGTEVHRIKSDAVGDEFEITIAPPPEVDGPVGVLYLTDAAGGIGTGVETVRQLSMAGEIPPVLLVGVGYPIGGDVAQLIRLRTRDCGVQRV